MLVQYAACMELMRRETDVQEYHGIFAVFLNSPVKAYETVLLQIIRMISEYYFFIYFFSLIREVRHCHYVWRMATAWLLMATYGTRNFCK